VLRELPSGRSVNARTRGHRRSLPGEVLHLPDKPRGAGCRFSIRISLTKDTTFVKRRRYGPQFDAPSFSVLNVKRPVSRLASRLLRNASAPNVEALVTCSTPPAPQWPPGPSNAAPSKESAE